MINFQMKNNNTVFASSLWRRRRRALDRSPAPRDRILIDLPPLRYGYKLDIRHGKNTALAYKYKSQVGTLRAPEV